jgi:hypothetical protein
MRRCWRKGAWPVVARASAARHELQGACGAADGVAGRIDSLPVDGPKLFLPWGRFAACVGEARTPLNFGFDRVRFVAPVPVGSRVRGRFVLVEASLPKPGQCELRWHTTVEIEGTDRPALVADWRTRFLL